MNMDRRFLTDSPPIFNVKTEMADSHVPLYGYSDAGAREGNYSAARSASNSMWI